MLSRFDEILVMVRKLLNSSKLPHQIHDPSLTSNLPHRQQTSMRVKPFPFRFCDVHLTVWVVAARELDTCYLW